MVAISQGNVSNVRNFLLAIILLATTYVLFHNFHPAAGFSATSYTPSRWFYSGPPRITKITTNLDKSDMLESALATHHRQNDIHGYDMRILRERPAEGWTNQATYLLSLLVNELEKPEAARTEWMIWLQPDVLVLNPRVPFEIFLPPEPEIKDVHVIATHDHHGELDDDVFFVRVHEWSVKMLLDVLAQRDGMPDLQQASQRDQFALDRVLKGGKYRDSVVFQPRAWYNSYSFHAKASEYEHGQMQLHFQGKEGDKWIAMDQTIDLLSKNPAHFDVPLRETTYLTETTAYWKRMMMARKTLEKAKIRSAEPEIAELVKRLTYAMNYEADDERKLQEAIDGLRDSFGVVNGEHAI